MPFKRLLSAILIALVCLATPTQLWANPTEEELETAKGHFSTGAEFYASGEYSKAIVEFINGHNIAPNAMFLYNISLCYQRLDNLADARDAAIKARGFEGMPQDVQVRNDARIASFDRITGARDIASAFASANAKAEADAKIEEPAPPTEQPNTFGALGWAGVGVATIGAAGLVYAFILNGQVASDKELIDEATAQNDLEEAQRLTDEANSTRETGLLFLFVGIGLTAAGLGMITFDLLDGPSEQNATLRIGPSPDGRGVAAGLSTTF